VFGSQGFGGGKGIMATADDVGRRVALPIWSGPVLRGALASQRGCGKCGVPCCSVLYDGENAPVHTAQAALDWEE
jgi:hypothetical protein